MQNPSIHNYSIDLFRFLLIIWIALFHYTGVYNNIDGVSEIVFSHKFSHGGSVGVSLFFIISGYFMAKSLINERFLQIIDYFEYCLHRYWRFWPTYAFSVVVISVWIYWFPVPTKEVSLPIFFINLLCIIHPGGFVDGAHWFLKTLLEIDFLLALLRFIPLAIRRFLIVTLFLGGAYLMLSVEISPSANIFIESLVKILVGVMLYMVRDIRKYSIRIIVLLCCSVIIIYALWQHRTTFIPAYLFLLVLLYFNVPVPNRIGQIFKFVGVLSFTWYLVHQNIGYSILYHCYPSGNLRLWTLLPLLGLTFLVAVLIDLGIKKSGIEHVFNRNE